LFILHLILNSRTEIIGNTHGIFSSFHQLMQSCGVRRPSLCPSVCPSVNILCKSLLYHKRLDHHQTCTRWSPKEPASRMCSRSKVTWQGHFCDFTKIASSRRQPLAGTLPNVHTMVPRRACIQGLLKVEVKGHVIWAFLWCHEMFAIQYGLTFCLYMRSLYEAPLHSPCSITIRQLDLMSKSWNELLRHWRSSLLNVNTLFRCKLYFLFRVISVLLCISLLLIKVSVSLFWNVAYRKSSVCLWRWCTVGICVGLARN